MPNADEDNADQALEKAMKEGSPPAADKASKAATGKADTPPEEDDATRALEKAMGGGKK
jgi:hypothetical protein